MPILERDGFPERRDIINMYRLVLGREPESDGVVVDKVEQRNAEWIPGFFRSDEFLEKIYDRVMGHKDVAGGLFDERPPHDLKQWAAEALPLTLLGRERLREATNWYQLYHAILTDTEFAGKAWSVREITNHELFIDRLREEWNLATLQSLDGKVEQVVPGEISGWALDRANHQRKLLVELYIDDHFCGGVVADKYRHDLQQRYGSDGCHGFQLRYNVASSRQGVTAIVKQAGTSAIIASFPAPSGEVLLQEAYLIKAMMDDISKTLEQIKDRLPSLGYGMTIPLTAYEEYYHLYYGLHQANQPCSQTIVDCAILIDTTRHPANMLQRVLRSIGSQTVRVKEIIVLRAPSQSNLDIDFYVQAWQRHSGFGGRIVLAGGDGQACGLLSIASTIQTDRIIWCPANCWLRPDAVVMLDAALASGAALAYGDNDVVEFDGAGREVHKQPNFRTAFDYDLLLQQGYIEGVVGFTREIPLIEQDASCLVDLPLILALRLEEEQRSDVISHLARILFHQTERGWVDGAALDRRRDLVEQHLTRIGCDAKVETRVDALGAPVSGTLRIRRASSKESRVAIVVPTRDRLDLLEPCLTSIIRSRSYNESDLDIIVVDNQSQDHDTLNYLDRVSSQEGVRVLLHDGPFNWSLMNNRAAQIADADVIIFCNNDTAVLSPRSWDEMSSHALRSDVGAVGARLLYEDGTIQHAGVVLDGWTSFASHEAVGQPGNSAGYNGRNALMRQTSTITGACLATRTSVFWEVGGFDAINLPVEGNDTDYCLKLVAAGYKILYNPDALLYHFESKSRGYNLDNQSREMAEGANNTLRARWPNRIGKDPFYNSHFDSLSPPCTRLRPPLR